MAEFKPASRLLLSALVLGIGVASGDTVSALSETETRARFEAGRESQLAMLSFGP